MLGAMSTDAWNPAQYDRFRAERQQPFYDLLDLVEKPSSSSSSVKVVDLGCGTGVTTRILHQRLGAATTVGVDRSPAMLQKARAQPAVEGLRFVEADITHDDDWTTPQERFDVVFSNACFHWIPDHETAFPALLGRVASGGQVAIQVPVNTDHPSHQTAHQLAASSPWVERLRGVQWPRVEAPEWYAKCLAQHGFARQRVFVAVYVHVLDERDDVVEWVKGSLLTEPQRVLSAEAAVEFEAAYRERLFAVLGDERPMIYTFKRLLIWGIRS